MIATVENTTGAITAAFLAGQERSARQTDNKGFDQLMSAAGQRETKQDTTVSTRKTTDKKRTDQQSIDAKDNDTMRDEKPAADREPKVKPETTAASEKPVRDKAGEVAEDEKAIVKKVAEACGVSEETVMQWLTAMNLKPLELADPKIANQFVQSVLQVQDPAELLTMSAFQTMLQDVLVATEPYKAVLASMEGAVQNASDMMTALQAGTDETGAFIEAADGLAELTELTPETADAQGRAEVSTPQTRPVETAIETSLTGSGNQTQDNALPFAQTAPDEQTQAVSFLSLGQGDGQVSGASTLSTPAGQQTTRVDGNDIMNQIMSRVKMQSGEGITELRVTLRPETLGDVTLKVATINGIVTAQFVAENERVREIIESNFNQLRNALQEQGVQVSELSVSVRQDDQTEQQNQFNRARQNSRQRMQRVISGLTAAEEETTDQPANTTGLYNNTVDYIV